MKNLLWLVLLGTSCFVFIDQVPIQADEQPSFEATLNKRIASFDTGGKTFVQNLIDLAFKLRMPMAVEFIDKDALEKPLSLKFSDISVRELLTSLTGSSPQYALDLSSGIVDLYSRRARADTSNVLNRIISNYTARNADTQSANLDLVCTLAREVEHAPWCGGSTAVGQWGTKTINVNAHEKPVYEILNAIVAQNGSAIWTITVPASQLSKYGNDIWHIYPLARGKLQGDCTQPIKTLNKTCATN